MIKENISNLNIPSNVKLVCVTKTRSVEEIKQAINQLESRTHSINVTLAESTQYIAANEQSLAPLTAQIDAVGERLDGLVAQYNRLEGNLADVQTDLKALGEMKERIETMYQDRFDLDAGREAGRPS